MNKLITITDRERELTARLAEAERHCEELAAQVEVMRGALATAEGWIIIPDGNCSCHISPPCSNCIDKGNAEFDDEQIKAALNMPNTAADILRQRDARTLRQAASRFSRTRPSLCVGNSLDAMADELAPRTLRIMEESHG